MTTETRKFKNYAVTFANGQIIARGQNPEQVMQAERGHQNVLFVMQEIEQRIGEWKPWIIPG